MRNFLLYGGGILVQNFEDHLGFLTKNLFTKQQNPQKVFVTFRHQTDDVQFGTCQVPERRPRRTSAKYSESKTCELNKEDQDPLWLRKSFVITCQCLKHRSSKCYFYSFFRTISHLS